MDQMFGRSPSSGLGRCAVTVTTGGSPGGTDGAGAVCVGSGGCGARRFPAGVVGLGRTGVSVPGVSPPEVGRVLGAPTPMGLPN